MSNKLHAAIHYIKHLALAKRGGHGVHSPFAFQLCEEVFYNEAAFYDFEVLGKIRESLQADQNEILITDLGAGSKVLKTNRRKISEIVTHGISSKRQSEIIYRLINYLQPRLSIELGTSIGLNTLYMAKANPYGKVISIEGAEALHNSAKTLADKNMTRNIEFILGNFNDKLPETLAEVKLVDLIYFDGNHTFDATMHYFTSALLHKKETSVFIIDDIYWSEGMTRAWKEIKKHPSVTMSLDLFYFGLVFFRREIKEKIELRLFI